METNQDFDLCIIGGGVNGAGIARDAAGRGLKVLLLEKGDLACATSSASTKLIHGGLRYLEFYEFKLVRESLKEREVLLRLAPHIIRPLDFVLPHHPGIRPLWMIGIGLKIYDLLGGRKSLKSSKILNLASHDFGKPLKSDFAKGFSYADCWVEDSRLVVLNALDAAERGAMIKTRHECMAIAPQKMGWDVRYKNMVSGEIFAARAAMIVNAAGPWVQDFLIRGGFYDHDAEIPKIKLIKGSHIIIPKAFDGDQAYILQQPDGRIVFAIPYERKFTLIGTTDVPFTSDAGDVKISPEETEYLCAAFNRFFEKQIAAQDVISSYSGVRALFDDGADEARAVTRDYKIYHHQNFSAPFLSIFGGKITTYRKLSEQVVNTLMNITGQNKPAWTIGARLPGAENLGDFELFLRQQSEIYPWMPLELLRRYARSYGSRLYKIIGGAQGLSGLGMHYGDDVYAAEINYLKECEFALTLEDILWRRSKLGLHISPQTKNKIEKEFSV